MTVEVLLSLMEKHNIPKNVTIKSDSGWECNETEMDGIYYNRELNTMIFTQEGTVTDTWFDEPGWKLIYGNNLNCQGCEYVDELGDCSKRKDDDGDNLAICITDVHDCTLFKKKGRNDD